MRLNEKIKFSLIGFLLVGLLSSPALCQDFGGFESKQAESVQAVEDQPKETVGRNGLRRQLVKAAVSAQRKGEISRRELVTIRVASFSPAFLERVETLCVTQMAFSGDATEEILPVSDTGEIDRTSIDWEGLANFLEKVIPLVLTLLKAFGL